MAKLSTNEQLQAEIDRLRKRIWRLELMVAALGHEVLPMQAAVDAISKDDARALRNSGARRRPVVNVELPGQMTVAEIIEEIDKAS